MPIYGLIQLFIGLPMTRIKSPGLLIRISHLILIQIVFIFSALALVLFYPSNLNNAEHHLINQSNKIQAMSSQLFDLGLNPNLSAIDTAMTSTANQIIRESNDIYEIDLVLFHPESGQDSIIYLTGKTGEKLHRAHDLMAGATPYLAPKANGTPLPILSDDGNYLSYFVHPETEPVNYAFIITAVNPLNGVINNSQVKIFFLLFLFSTLISLLIMNLISRGIKKPLMRLHDAFDKTANGEEHYITEEEGDKDIQQLIRGFNNMSQSLSEKQRRLALANRDLIKANKSLIQSESILTALVDYSPDAIIVTDLEDQVIIYNQQAARDFGFNQHDMLGKKVCNLMAGLSNRRSTPGDPSESQEIICRRRDGGSFPALLIQTTLGPDGARPIAMLYFIKNISESQNYQNMILKLDRIASRGKMARDIAHEINNYLAVLQGNLELLPMFMAKNDTAKCEQKLNVMKDTVTKISNFTDGLTQFSDENSEFAKEDLNQLVENLIAFLKPQNKYDEILIGTNLSDNLPLVEIDASQIQLLLVNLVSNAAEALHNFDGTRWIIISTSIDEYGENVYLKVSDSGPGVPQEMIPNLFVKRFSTHRGNGLGLITCKNAVDNHKGEMSYHSSDESRAVFIIRIPVRRNLTNSDSSPSVTESALSK